MMGGNRMSQVELLNDTAISEFTQLLVKVLGQQRYPLKHKHRAQSTSAHIPHQHKAHQHI